MQTLYVRELHDEESLKFLEGQLKNNLHRSNMLYLTMIQYIIEVCLYVLEDKNRRLAKFLKTQEDLALNTILARNKVVEALRADETLQLYFKQEKVSQYIDADIIRQLYIEVTEKQRYKEYFKLEETTIEADVDILAYIIKQVLTKNKTLDKHLEETFVNMDDDSGTLWMVLQKYVEGFVKSGTAPFSDAISYWEKEHPFALELLRKTYQHNEEITEVVRPFLKNWELERVAVMDLLILKLAMCELLYMPTIPVKVTINEYIDISKFYSTPKSKDFVNGVLDKAKNQLMDEGLIKKQGRGLVE
ncbi:MAG: transcription antitermination factor NusB [Chitinophagales bacterium]|nr:transcription antitermination factor NusB [Chitinophagales bacterium]HRN95383.1 transcription antitermination factor NusB [Chitinophagales bacterium]HRP40091.1 transcription antitermination factor NusB [Chitinophagales bacterium]